MKCPRCWAEKAYVRQVNGWQGFLLACLLLVPLKCHHCYHKFVVTWFSTIGKTIQPSAPRRTASPTPPGPSYAARQSRSSTRQPS